MQTVFFTWLILWLSFVPLALSKSAIDSFKARKKHSKLPGSNIYHLKFKSSNKKENLEECAALTLALKGRSFEFWVKDCYVNADDVSNLSLIYSWRYSYYELSSGSAGFDDKISPFIGFSGKKGEKTGGIHDSDPEGGIYKSSNGKDTFLIKRDVTTLSNDIAEFMAAALFQKIAPGSAAEISLVDSSQTKRTFLASKFFKDNYRDLFIDLKQTSRQASLEALQALIPAVSQYVRKGLSSLDAQGNWVYQNYVKAIVPSLLLGDKSVHSGNIGVVDGRNGEKTLVRIDFGAAFRNLSPEIEPFKSETNRVGLEKNYFLRDHPRKRIFTREFSDELKRESKIDLRSTIESAWKKIIQHYDNTVERTAIKDFGRQIGVQSNLLDQAERQNNQYSILKDRFQAIMKQRQQSLKDIAFEIDITLAFSTQEMVRAIRENLSYAKALVNNPSKVLQLKFKLTSDQRLRIKNGIAIL